MNTGEREFEARRFRRDYLCIFLELIEHMFYYLDVSSRGCLFCLYVLKHALQ